MMVAIFGVWPDTPFWDKLQKDECKSLSEFYRRTDKIMRLEMAREAIQAKKSTPTEKNNDNGKKRKNEVVAHLQKRQIRSPRLQIRESYNLLPASSRTTPTQSPHQRTFSWLWSRQRYSTGLTRYMETAPRWTKTNIAGTTKTSVTPLRNASPSRMRSRSSFTAGTSKIMLMIGGQCCKMIDLKKNPNARSGRSSAGPILPGKHVEHKTVTSGRWRRSRSSMSQSMGKQPAK